MLQEFDHEIFIELLEKVENEQLSQPVESPDVVLRTNEDSNKYLYKYEFTQLWRALKIACAAGDATETAFHVFDKILQNLTEESRCYVPLADRGAWSRAIRWAISRKEPSDITINKLSKHDREIQVGMACKRLRECGYHIRIRKTAPQLSPETQSAIASKINYLISKIGGEYAAKQICTFMSKRNALHDGLWLLGNRVGGTSQASQPALPIGWLFSIAIRNFHIKPSSPEPEKEWRKAVKLATDFAACMNCQRYNQFNGLYLHAVDFVPTLLESLMWRELFSIPQVPPLTLTTLRKAFSQIKWPRDTEYLHRKVDLLFSEVDCLIGSLFDNKLTEISRQSACYQYPLLWQHARAEAGAANPNYLEPFEKGNRNQDWIVFFEISNGNSLVLPRAITMAAACTAIFRLIWSEGGEDASCIVGNTIEKAVALACREKTDSVCEQVCYIAEGKQLEIDLATRNGKEVILFETKAKSLTAASRSGDMMAYIEDYMKSFLSLVKQLIRHDRNLKKGLTPITEAGENLDAIRVTKVAVSPLCYGPASDKLLAGSLLRSILSAQFEPVNPDSKNSKILKKLNRTVHEIKSDLQQFAPRKNDEIDLYSYLHDIFWLDLGQLLYILNRGLSIGQGFAALRSITFSTRDFWTEVAFLDRQRFTVGKWRPPFEGRY